MQKLQASSLEAVGALNDLEEVKAVAGASGTFAFGELRQAVSILGGAVEMAT